MLYTKDGYPDVNEIVKCTVTKIYGNSTFVHLDEYEKEGVLTISEIAPGRIRNLRDHVSEDRVIICKVLRVDAKLNRIDVSLRRVPIPVMKKKQEELKKEEFSEKVYLDVAKELDFDKEALFEKTYEPIFEDYGTVFEALYDIMIDNTKASMFTGLDDKQRAIFVKIINDKIKPEEVAFKAKFDLTSISPIGVNLIKEAIDNSIKPINYDKFNVVYLAAGTFGVTIVHDDMKSAAILFDKFKKTLETQAKEKNLDLEIME